MGAPGLDSTSESRLRDARVARLATSGRDRPTVVPVCFVYDGERIYTALDRKPKGVPPGELARVRHIERDPRVSLLVDDYFEDWTKLWYVLVRGRAELVSDETERVRALSLLRDKYPQYRTGLLPDDAPVIGIAVDSVSSWSS